MHTPTYDKPDRTGNSLHRMIVMSKHTDGQDTHNVYNAGRNIASYNGAHNPMRLVLDVAAEFLGAKTGCTATIVQEEPQELKDGWLVHRFVVWVHNSKFAVYATAT